MSKRLLHVLALIAISVTMLGASTPDKRFDHLGHQLVCQCGCGQILLECNHVNCPVSGPMIEELKAQLATGLPDAGVLGFFISKYGPIALAAPIRGGFDNAAWIFPIVVLLAGILGVVLVLRHWRARHTVLHPAGTPDLPTTTSPTMRHRIRQETDDEL